MNPPTEPAAAKVGTKHFLPHFNTMKKRYYFDYEDESGKFVDGEGDLFSDFESVEAE